MHCRRRRRRSRVLDIQCTSDTAVRRILTFDKGLRLFNQALSLNGTRVGVTCAEVDLSGNCQRPVTVEYVGRRERFMLKMHEVSPRFNDPLTWESVSVIMHCKCRQCESCLRQKRIHWYHRAKFEMSVAPRTWFGTLTYAPEEILRRQIIAERKAHASIGDWAQLDADQRFKALLEVCSKDVSLALKRLRKASPGLLRYLTVSERHKSGLPHFHILIHERTMSATTHAKLKACWTAGFSDFKLAEPETAGYVAKYISKDASARVRASLHYGSQSALLKVSVAKANEGSGTVARSERDRSSLGDNSKHS